MLKSSYWLVALGFSLQGWAAPAPVPLNSTVMLMGDWDWHKERGRCKAIVDEALSQSHHNLTLNFLPTHFHVNDPEFSDPNRLQYCHSRYFEDGRAICPILDAQAIAEFRDGLTDCFRYAVKRGQEVNGKPLSISIVPHIDDGGTTGRWRNTIAFDPYPQAEEQCLRDPSKSYYCSLLKPVAEALSASIDADSRVYFAMQGEMGATVFAYPEAYQRLATQLRRIILEPRPDLAPEQIDIGLSLNFNRVSGELFEFDQLAVQQLFDRDVIDFIGLSSYGEISLRPYPSEFENTIETFAGELDYFGISLQDLMNQGVELHFSEFGVGGGNINGRKVDDSWYAASSPWGGVHGPFAKATNPWAAPDVLAFQKAFYCAGLHYLSGQYGRSWKISHAFIWNLTSWDVQGVYPYSISPDGSYRNSEITTWIRNYNAGGQLTCPVQLPLVDALPTANLLDDFESYKNKLEVLKRTYLFNPKAIGVQSIEVQGDEAQRMVMSYWLGTGSWDKSAGVMRKGRRDWSGARGVQLWIKPGSGVPKDLLEERFLRFGIRERSGEFWEIEVPFPGPAGAVVQLPFDRFVVPDYVDNKIGDRQLDLDHIVEFDLTVAGTAPSREAETVEFDQLLLLR